MRPSCCNECNNTHVIPTRLRAARAKLMEERAQAN
jgi:hypothetical protein